MKRLALVSSLLLCVLAAGPALGQERILAVTGGAANGATDAGAVGEIDPMSGAFTALNVPVPGSGLTGLASTTDGRLFAVTNGAQSSEPPVLIELDPTTGALIQTVGQILDPTGAPVYLQDLALQPGTNTLYGAVAFVGGDTEGGQGNGNGGVTEGGDGQNALVTIDLGTAEITEIGLPDFGGIEGGYVAIAFTPDGTLWGKDTNESNLFTLDPSDASVLTTQTITALGGGLGGLGLGSGSDGRLYLSECCDNTTGNDIYTLDTNTLEATLLGPAGADRRVHDFIIAGAPVSILDIPTLGEWGLLALLVLLAGAGIVFVRRR
ncbi:MAG: IPTL-CTERM sorting domain-containing protein [Acidobacteriota bacterium]